jgi:SAM-dependent methyltransferase
MQKKDSYEKDAIPSIGIWHALNRNRFFSRFAKLLDPPDPVIVTKRNRARIPQLLAKLDVDDKSLNIGSGSTNYSKDIINLDLFPLTNVNVIGNSGFLPFKQGIFSMVICQAVLEHVEKPIQTVNEIYRVLKKDGIVYVEIPFFQGYHAVPSDFQRYTISGIQKLFRQFKLIEKGVLAGPSSALVWTLREFLSIALSFNNLYLYRIFNLIFGWLTFPLKYLDIYLDKSRFAHIIASGFFLIGKK